MSGNCLEGRVLVWIWLLQISWEAQLLILLQVKWVLKIVCKIHDHRFDLWAAAAAAAEKGFVVWILLLCGVFSL